MLLPTTLLVLMATFVSQACDKEIINQIKNDNMLQKDAMDYIKDKTFITVYYGGNYPLLGLLSEEVTCAWFKIKNNKQGEPEIVYSRKKLSRFWMKVAYETLRKLDPMSLAEEKLQIKEIEGVINEKDNRRDPKFYTYPLYLNKEAGVYAYHRCRAYDNGLRDKWWTVIAVNSEKIGDPPMQFKDPNTWLEVENAFKTISKIRKIKNQVSLTIPDSDRCAFDKKWPKLGIED